jgi:homoserine kinase
LKGTTADGSELYLEVVDMPSSNSTPTVACEGVLYQLQPADATDTPWQLQPVDWVLQPSLDLVKALPGWAAAVQQQQARQQLPQQPLLLQSVANVYSAAALQAAVQQNPAPWRDGIGQ